MGNAGAFLGSPEIPRFLGSKLLHQLLTLETHLQVPQTKLLPRSSPTRRRKARLVPQDPKWTGICRGGTHGEGGPG